MLPHFFFFQCADQFMFTVHFYDGGAGFCRFNCVILFYKKPFAGALGTFIFSLITQLDEKTDRNVTTHKYSSRKEEKYE